MKINRDNTPSEGPRKDDRKSSANQPGEIRRTRQEQPAQQEFVDEYEEPGEEDEEDEEDRPRRRFPFGLLVLVIILALVDFGGWKVMQFYGEVDGRGELGEEKTITIEQGTSVAGISQVLKENGII